MAADHAHVRGRYHEVFVDLRGETASIVITLERRRGEVRVPVPAGDLARVMAGLKRGGGLRLRIEFDDDQATQLLADLAHTADWFRT